MSAWDDIRVPAAGEIVIEQGSNKIKIGDGKTNFANLPYVEGNPPENKLSDRARELIENNIDLIERNEYDAFYNEIHDVELAREVSKALFKAGLNPKPYVTTIPRGCQDVFYYEGEKDPNDKKKRGWVNINNPHPNRGKTQYQWITTSPKDDKYFNDFITDKKLENYLNPVWELDDDE